MKSDTIQRIEIWPIDVPITDPFVVATGARVTAQNLFVRVTLRDGTCGYGEAAPFPEVGGEDRASCFDTATVLATPLVGQSVAGYQSIADTLQAQAILYPAARCGLETAILDAYNPQLLGVPLWQLWGSGGCPGSGNRHHHSYLRTGENAGSRSRLVCQGISTL